MSILIIEDDIHKLKQLTDFIKSNYPHFEISCAHSYQSGLEAIIETQPDLVLLDMSLPTYDVAINEKGGRPRSFGGRDILSEVRRKKIASCVIIVTQFDDFRDDKETKNLEELKSQLAKQFKQQYKGTVFYQPSGIEWQSELKNFIDMWMRESKHD